jgi:non-specific serine/threonine protein kinase/serine/threonine-protein kinase
VTPERYKQVRDLADAALDRPEGERRAFLAATCGADEALCDEVTSLLAADEEVQGLPFLAGPAPLTDDGGPTSETGDVEALPVGRRVGPYEIVAVLGHGGMGTVYRAVRDDDAFRKTVALKLVRGGRHSNDFRRRFRQERKILAGLQHPNIATVLDGGTTEEGQPYLVMEYVEGQPITDFCAAHGLDTRARLALFRTVCGAVQYAHQSLVVHRDIKPANVQVDARGVPKLLDFGIAKALASGVDPDLAPTVTVLPMMTPDYASPEQVKGQPVTTASDVYSLGVLLYELLAGRRPYEVQSDSLEAIVWTICQTEPRPPSEAVTGGAGTTRSGRTLPLASELRGDLDTIVLKALRKEPERRYRTAHELSEDLRRHLEGLPVTARADTMGYRAAKFVRRHRTPVVAAALVSASLVAGLVTTIREARIAEANRRRAEQRFGEVRGLATFVMFDMHDAISPLPGSTLARKKLVEKSLEYLDRLAAEASDPALLEELAAGYQRLSQVQGDRGVANLGDEAAAIETARKALALRERVAAARPGDVAAAASLAKSHGLLAGLLRTTDRSAGSAALDKMRAVLDAIPRGDAGRAAVLEGWERYWFTRSNFSALTRDLESMRESRGRQVRVAEELLALEPQNASRQRNVATACKYYGAVLQELGELEAAGELYEKARALDQALVEKDPSNPDGRLDLSFSLASIGTLRRDQGDLEGALATCRRALDLRRAVHAEDPANGLAFSSLVRGHERLADVLARMGDVEGAVLHVREALDLRGQWERTHPSRHGPRAWQASFHAALGDIFKTAATSAQPALRRRERWQRARQEYARALALWNEIAGAKPLEGDDAGQPERLRTAIADCDRARAPVRQRQP